MNGEHLLSRSLSSDCLSLSCSETDMGDASADEDESYADVGHELPGSDTDAARPFGEFSTRNPTQDELYRVLREDLQKQEKVRDMLTSDNIKNNCGSARRLPATHRALIVGWMREVARALRLHMSTLFTAASLLDRFVASAQSLPADGMLRLLALACVSVAVKYEEVGRVLPNVWLGLALGPDGRRLYTPQDLQDMEFSVLAAIGWKLRQPSTHTFLENFLLAMPHARGFTCCSAAADRRSAAGDGRVQGQCGTAAAATASELSKVLATLTADATLLLRAWPVACGAVALAETSLMYDIHLPYDHSTIALACIVLSERILKVASPGAADCDPSFSAAACSVAATAQLPVEQLAPGLGPCVEALNVCYMAHLHSGRV